MKSSLSHTNRIDTERNNTRVEKRCIMYGTFIDSASTISKRSGNQTESKPILIQYCDGMHFIDSISNSRIQWPYVRRLSVFCTFQYQDSCRNNTIVATHY